MYQLVVFREGRLLSLKVQYQLGPYRPPGAWGGIGPRTCTAQ